MAEEKEQSNILVDSSGKPVMDGAGKSINTGDLETQRPNYKFDPEGMKPEDKRPVFGARDSEVLQKLFEGKSKEEIRDILENVAKTQDLIANTLDRNGDGKVDVGELKQADDIFKRMYHSQRGDGYITSEEFKGNLDRLYKDHIITHEQMTNMWDSAQQKEFNNASITRIPASPLENIKRDFDGVDLKNVPNETVLIADTRENGNKIREFIPKTLQAHNEHKIETEEQRLNVSKEQNEKTSFNVNDSKLGEIIARMKSGNLSSAESSANHVNSEINNFVPTPTYKNVVEVERSK